jgi:hypothetical protein
MLGLWAICKPARRGRILHASSIASYCPPMDEQRRKWLYCIDLGSKSPDL